MGELVLALVKKESAALAPDPAIEVSKFTKYDGKMAPELFVTNFEAEFQLMGLNGDDKKTAVFPSLMTGKAAYGTAELRVQLTWVDMELKFIDMFSVQRNVVLTEL